MVLEGLLYSETHEWVKVDGKVATIGITDHAQHALGSVVFIDLPRIGTSVKPGDTVGAVESVKAASDLYCPVKGKLIEVNQALEDAPEMLNDDPYGSWIMKVELDDPSELGHLLSKTQYEPLCED